LSVRKRVIVDKRERASKVAIHLKALGVKVEYRILAIGDYITASGYAVERKEAHDFIGSLFSGRLFDQARYLSEAYDDAAIIAEGRFQTLFGSMANPRAMWGCRTIFSF
jgi:DNA excision repair protein ERCC-4